MGVSSQGICVKYLGSQRRKELWVEVQDETKKKKKKKARKRGNIQKRKGLWVGGREGWGALRAGGLGRPGASGKGCGGAGSPTREAGLGRGERVRGSRGGLWVAAPNPAKAPHSLTHRAAPSSA